MSNVKKEYRKFKMPGGRIIKLAYIPSPKIAFVAQCPHELIYHGKSNIEVSELFLKEFTNNEKIAIIGHELWHKKNNQKSEREMCKRNWSLKVRFFIYWIVNMKPREILNYQEFSADLQGAKIGGRNNMLSTLKKLKKLIQNKIIPSSHEKTHPPIDERIARLQVKK